jgi:hypothetical protein
LVCLFSTKTKGENQMKNEELIKKMKNNWTAWGGLSDKEREFLRENSDSVGLIISSGSLCCVGDCSFDADNLIYRLSPDFSLPESAKRWFFNLTSNELFECAGEGPQLEACLRSKLRGNSIEVREEDLPYLEKPEGEWAFRQLERGDQAICFLSSGATDQTYFYNGDDQQTERLSGYRWCKPREPVVAKAPEWVEYPIYAEVWREDHARFVCDYEGDAVPVHELPSIVGFAGVQFEGQEDENEWFTHLAGGIDNGVTFTCLDASDQDEKVATPIKARFYVGK